MSVAVLLLAPFGETTCTVWFPTARLLAVNSMVWSDSTAPPASLPSSKTFDPLTKFEPVMVTSSEADEETHEGFKLAILGLGEVNGVLTTTLSTSHPRNPW